MDADYIYKRLDNASLGHEADKAWVLDNLQTILDYIDELVVEIDRLGGIVDEEL